MIPETRLNLLTKLSDQTVSCNTEAELKGGPD